MVSCSSVSKRQPSGWVHLGRGDFFPQNPPVFSQPLHWLVSLTQSLPVFPFPHFPVWSDYSPCHVMVLHAMCLLMLVGGLISLQLMATVDVSPTQSMKQKPAAGCHLFKDTDDEVHWKNAFLATGEFFSLEHDEWPLGKKMAAKLSGSVLPISSLSQLLTWSKLVQLFRESHD